MCIRDSTPVELDREAKMRVLRKLPKLIAILAFVATALILLAQQVFRLPDLDGRIPSYALGITADTTLGAKVSPPVSYTHLDVYKRQAI